MTENKGYLRCFGWNFAYWHEGHCCFCRKLRRPLVPFEKFGAWHYSCVMCLRFLFPYPQVHYLRRFFQ